MKNFNLWFIFSLIAIFAMTCASQWNITHEDTAQPNSLYTDEPTEHDTIKLADNIIGQGTNRFDLDFIDVISDGVYLLTVNLSNGHRYTQKLIHQN
jgi:hypothetical protein